MTVKPSNENLLPSPAAPRLFSCAPLSPRRPPLYPSPPSCPLTPQDRGYVSREGRSLLPTSLGRVLTAFLEHYFPSYVDYDFTSDMEGQLDEVAGGWTGRRTGQGAALAHDAVERGLGWAAVESGGGCGVGVWGLGFAARGSAKACSCLQAGSRRTGGEPDERYCRKAYRV